VKAREIPLRITVLQPPAGVVFALQRGRSELQGATGASGEALWFDFGVRIRPEPDARANSPPVCGPARGGPGSSEHSPRGWLTGILSPGAAGSPDWG
jgi:hypothetical protein